LDTAQESKFEEYDFTFDLANVSVCNILIAFYAFQVFIEYSIEVYLGDWERFNLNILILIPNSWCRSCDPSFKLIDPAFLTFSQCELLSCQICAEFFQPFLVCRWGYI